MAEEIDLEEFKRGYAAVGSRNWEEAMEIYHPEIEWHDPPELPEAASYVGHDGVRQAWEKFDEAWDKWHLEPLEYEQIGDDRLLVRVRITGLGTGSGVETTGEFFQLWRLRDGLIVSQHGFFDEAQARAAAEA